MLKNMIKEITQAIKQMAHKIERTEIIRNSHEEDKYENKAMKSAKGTMIRMIKHMKESLRVKYND